MPILSEGCHFLKTSSITPTRSQIRVGVFYQYQRLIGISYDGYNSSIKVTN